MPLVGARPQQERALPRKSELKAFYHASIDPDRREGAFYIVRPPIMVRVSFHDETYRIQLPWQLFGTCLSFKAGIGYLGSGLWFMKKEPKDRYERVYRAPLPNMNGYGIICYGNAKPYWKLPLVKYVDRLYQGFWMSPFTSEMGDISPSLPREWDGEDDCTCVFDSWRGEGNDVSAVQWEPARYRSVAGVIRMFPKDLIGCAWARSIQY